VLGFHTDPASAPIKALCWIWFAQSGGTSLRRKGERSGTSPSRRASCSRFPDVDTIPEGERNQRYEMGSVRIADAFRGGFMMIRSRSCTCDSATPAMSIATSSCRLPIIGSSSINAESKGRFFHSHIRDHFRYERHGQTSRRLITKRHFSRTQAPLCGEDLLDPSADSERLTCHRSPELRKDRLTSGLGPPDAPIAS